MSIVKLWQQLSNVGVTDNTDYQNKISIRVTNRIALISSAVTIVFYLSVHLFMWEDYYTNRSFHVFHLVTGLLFVPILLLNKYGKFNYASLLFIACIYVISLINSLSMRQSFISDQYFLLLAAFIFVVFNKWRIIIPVFILQAIAYYFVRLRMLEHNPNFFSLESGFELRVAIVFSLLFFLLFILRNENNQYRKKLQEKTYQLSKDRNSMAKLNFTKDKIFSIVSHDLRSPIAVLKGFLSLLKDDRLTIEEFKKETSGLENQVEQLHKSLDEMLVWSKAQLSGLIPKPSLIELAPIVEESFAINKQMSIGKKISLTSIVPRGLMIYVDPNMMKSIINNLVGNALKFTNYGGVVSVFVENDDGLIHINIADTGVGIKEIDISKILSKTDYHTTYGTNNEKGTGLGLTMCKEFVEIHDGTLTVTSQQDIGSVFKISLPHKDSHLNS